MFTPENEMGVIVVFAQVCEASGWEMVSIRSAFPDAVIRNKETQRTYEVEFEFASQSFVEHGHDPRGCDMIICWEHNLTGIKFPVWELSKGEVFDFVEVSPLEKENAYLIMQNRRLSCEVSALRQRLEGERIPIARTHEIKLDGVRLSVYNALRDNPGSNNHQIGVLIGKSRETVRLAKLELQQAGWLSFNGSNHTNGKGG